MGLTRRTSRWVLAVSLAGLAAIVGNQRHPLPPTAGFLPTSGTLSSETGRTSRSSNTLRVGLYNIHRGRDGNRNASLARQADLLRAARLDVVALVEVDGRFGAQGNQADDLGKAIGLEALFAPTERRWWHDSLGNAVLTRLPITHWQRQPLPRIDGNGFRNLLRVELDVGGTRVTLLVTHLDREGDQQRQLAMVAKAFLDEAAPVVLAGDMNLTRDDPVLANLLAQPGVVDVLAKSGSDDDPGRIDWILVRGCRARAAARIDSDASDHPLLWAELECKESILVDSGL